MDNKLMEPITIYCDGSGTTADQPAGIGVYIDDPYYYYPIEISEHIGNGTNNVAELTAVLRALQYFDDKSRDLIIKTDSQYTIGSLTKPWNPKANKELIETIKNELKLWKGKVIFQHVKGHAGIVGNEKADQLAKSGREKGLKG